MAFLIIIVVIILFIVLLGFTWHRLDTFEKKEKVIICIIGILVSLVITSILFAISARGIDYINTEVKSEIRKILISVFTPINGLIYMPYIAKMINKIKLEQIQKDEFQKNIIILCIIAIILFIIEGKYLTNIQQGIIDLANSIQK